MLLTLRILRSGYPDGGVPALTTLRSLTNVLVPGDEGVLTGASEAGLGGLRGYKTLELLTENDAGFKVAQNTYNFNRHVLPVFIES